MKNKIPAIAALFAALSALALAALAFATVFFPATATDERDLFQGDFSLRYNEVRCLRQGVDPFDVWSGKIGSEQFARLGGRRDAEAQELVHAYTPWEYTAMLPMSLVPPGAAKETALALNAALYLALIAWALAFARKQGRGGGAACFIGALAFGFNIWAWKGALFWGNFGGLFTAMIVLLAFALAKGGATGGGGGGRRPRKYDVYAGIALAALMFKPQVGVMFCIPLLVNLKFATLASGAAICLLASVPPAIMCRKWPWEMISNVIGGGADVYHSSALININLHNKLISMFALGPDQIKYLMYASMLIGVLLCLALSLMLRRSDDWLEKLVPAALIAPLWTYSVPHDLAIWTVPAVWMLARKTGWRKTGWRKSPDLLCESANGNGSARGFHSPAEFAKGAAAWAVALCVMALAAVACYRAAWDWFRVWTLYWQPVMAEKFSALGVFTVPPAVGKPFWWRNFDKGLGYEYKLAVLAAFIVWSAFRAWQLNKQKD